VFLFLSFFIVVSQINGNDKVSTEKILVLAPVKNIEKGFCQSKKNITKFVSFFSDYRIIIYENNSSDKTKELFLKWKKTEPKLLFFSENLDQTFLSKLIKSPIGNCRTEIIARARNILIEKACAKEFEDYHIILMADLDSFGNWDIEQMLDTLRHPEHEWDAIMPAATYDLYAIRGAKFLLNPEIITVPTWAEFLPRIGTYYANYLSQDRWVLVDSAFGGLCFLNKINLDGIKYEGLMSPSYLDDLLNKDFSNDCIYRLNPEKFDKEIQIYKNNLLAWKDSGFHNSKIPENAYNCEHAMFFFNMRKRGFDRIYINPRWQHFSNEHPNYPITRRNTLIKSKKFGKQT